MLKFKKTQPKEEQPQPDRHLHNILESTFEDQHKNSEKTHTLLEHHLEKAHDNGKMSEMQHEIGIEQRGKILDKMDEHTMAIHDQTDQMEKQHKELMDKQSEKPQSVQLQLPADVKVLNIKGDQGEKGEKGDTGDQGPEGPEGPIGESLTGPRGIEGRQGPKGPQGDSIVGPPGPEGPRGLQGPIGPKGQKGDDFSMTVDQMVEMLKGALPFDYLKNAPQFRGMAGTGYLREISDINITKLQDGDVIKWNAATSKWVNGTGGSGGGGTWGSITGTLSDQTDLQTALNAKVPTSTTVNGKALSTSITLTTADIADSTDKRYITDTQRTVLQNTSGTNTGDQTITLTGDVTGAGTGSFAATIAAGAVTLAKMANMATSSLIYRKTAGTGAPEVNTLATLKTDLGLTGTNSGDQTITLTGDITGTGTGSFVATIRSSVALSGNPTATTQAPGDNSTKIATTAYVDAAVLGQNFKEAVKYATTAALPAIVYNNGSSGVGATLTGVALAAISVDGASPAVNDRILVKNQVSTFQNGIYIVTATGSGIAAFVLTRATDANQSFEFRTGDSTFATSGTLNGGTTWAYTGVDSPTMGTDAITYVQTAGPGSFTAGNGIAITGTSIAVDLAVVVDKTTAQALTNKTLTSSTNVLGGVTMTLGSDGTGDIYYRSAGGVLTRLPIGTANQVVHGGTTPSYSAVVEGDFSFTDITTGNATTSQHGLLPKLGGGTTNFLRADGTWAAPGGGGSPGGTSGQFQYNNAGAFGGGWVTPAGTIVTGAQFVSSIKTFAATGNQDIYTCPANKRAIITEITLFNGHATNSGTMVGMIKIGGVYYPGSASTNVGAGQTGSRSITYILEAGETIAVNFTQQPFNVVCSIMEFDNTSNIKSVKVTTTTLVTGDNTIYTVPGGKSALLLNNTLTMCSGTQGTFTYGNGSGGNITIKWNVVASGGTPSASNQMSQSVTISTGLGSSQTLTGFTMGAGDFVNINISGGTADQIAFVTVVEI